MPSQFSTLSLHDALPIFHLLVAGDADLQCRHGITPLSRNTVSTVSQKSAAYGYHTEAIQEEGFGYRLTLCRRQSGTCAVIRVDRKSTRLNSSHTVISYAVPVLHSFPTRRSSDLSSPRSWRCRPSVSSWDHSSFAQHRVHRFPEVCGIWLSH